MEKLTPSTKQTANFSLRTSVPNTSARSADIPENIFDFSKPGEDIKFIGPYVIKYFADPQQVSSRVTRAKYLAGFVPPLVFSAEHLYGYQKINGSTLYENLDSRTINRFFNWCQSSFWNPQELKLTKTQLHRFHQSCRDFYNKKTNQRIAAYWQEASHKDNESLVNGIYTPPLSELIKQVDWNNLYQGTPSRFHGDLQFDNVLVTTNRRTPFVLLDWRGDFGGLLNFGDLYYDLSKIYGGLIITYREIKQNKFRFQQSGHQVSLQLPSATTLDPLRRQYENFLLKHQYDLTKVRLLTALIFLNMSPLHQPPFSTLLHHLGKLHLQQSLLHDPT